MQAEDNTNDILILKIINTDIPQLRIEVKTFLNEN